MSSRPTSTTCRCGADDLAAILYTSGTTGRPKGAMLTQRNLASNAAALHQIWGFRHDDVLLHALPVFHTHGLFVATNCVLANGTGMIFLPRFEPGAVIEQLPRATVLMGVPTFYTRLLADPRFTDESLPLDPAVRVRLCSAPGRHARSVRRPHRAGDPRALRHDRDLDDQLEPPRR